MDDYFHLDRAKFRPVGAGPADTDCQPRPPKRDDATDTHPALELEDPPRKPENTDPYNSTGRFNIKDLNW